MNQFVTSISPKSSETLKGECVINVREVPQLSGRSFQHLIVGQPIKLGGLGLRYLCETCPAAFLGGIEMSLPHLVESVGDVDGDQNLQGGMCPQLADVLGELFGPVRWEYFLTAGSRTSQEFSRSWKSVSTEARCIWQLLEKDRLVFSPLISKVQVEPVSMVASVRKSPSKERV